MPLSDVTRSLLQLGRGQEPSQAQVQAQARAVLGKQNSHKAWGNCTSSSRAEIGEPGRSGALHPLRGKKRWRADSSSFRYGHKLMQFGHMVADRPVTVDFNAGGRGPSEHCQLQYRHRLCRSMAFGFGALQVDGHQSDYQRPHHPQLMYWCLCSGL